MTLSFSEVVYWIPEDRDTSKICAAVGKNGVDEPAQIDPDGKIVPGKTSMLAHMGGNVDKLTPNAAATDNPTNTFTFSYSGVRVGYTLTLFTDGFICDRSGNSTVNTITLRYEETKTGVGGAITAGGWVIVQQ